MSQDVNFSGRIAKVRTSTAWPTVTFILVNAGKERQIILTKKQLEATCGVVRPHGLRGATMSGRLYPVGHEYSNGRGPNATITKQTQERFDLGRGVEDFNIDLSQQQDIAQGQLSMYRDAVTNMFTVQGQAIAATGSNTAAPEAPVAPVVEEPVLNELAGEDTI